MHASMHVLFEIHNILIINNSVFFLFRLPRPKWGTNLKEHTKKKLYFKNSDFLFVIKHHRIKVFDVLEE